MRNSYKLIIVLLSMQNVIHAGPDFMAKEEKAALKKRGVACLAGSALCALAAYRYKGAHDPLNFNPRATMNIDFFEGLRDLRLSLSPVSDSAKFMFLGLTSAYLGAYGSLCLLKPKLAKKVSSFLSK